MADVRTASTAARAVAIALSILWVAVLACLPGRWIVRLFRQRDRSE